MTLKVALNQEGLIPLDAAFSCDGGQVLALVGSSGSGKSTILRAIAGTYRSLHGSITVSGACWFDSVTGHHLPAHRRAVGMVFQNYALFPHMTALQNVTTAMDHVPRRTRAAKAASLLDLVHLSGLADRRPAELSGGQQQRVALARALAREPDVLLLDEPFSAVDRATRQCLYREIAELRRLLKMPVILVTHDLDEAVMLADRMTVLDRGRTLQTGTPDEVMTQPVSVAVARLVDLRNVFEGTVASRDTMNGRVLIEWAGRRIEARAMPNVSEGQPVHWVVPDGFVVLHQPGRPARSCSENAVSGTIETMVTLGQTAHLTLRPRHDPAFPVHFAVPLHVARRNAVAKGAEATVSLLAQGIHIMPASAAPAYR